jgi:hypothetical protein
MVGIGLSDDPSLRLTSWSCVHADLTQPDPHRFDVEFLLETVKYLIADDALVAERDHGAPFGAECLMPEPAKGGLGFGSSIAFTELDGRGLRIHCV